jgi:hypothetical protein
MFHHCQWHKGSGNSSINGIFRALPTSSTLFPVVMCYHWLSLLIVLSAVSLADLETPPPPLWSDIRVKHTWNTVPANWESLGPPPTNTTIDLYVALKPQRANALIDALYEVSNPGHQKFVVITTHPLVLVLTCAAAPFQIWRPFVQGAGG